MKTDTRGFSLTELMVGIAIIALLMTLMVPNYIHSRNRSRMVMCLSNLKLIKQALTAYMTQNNLNPNQNAVPFYQGVIVNHNSAYIEQEPLTPVHNRSYSITTFGEDPTCPNRDEDPGNQEFFNHIL